MSLNLLLLRVGPPVLRRWLRWCIGLSIVCAVLAGSLLAWCITLTPGKPLWQRNAIIVLGLLPITVISPVGHWLQRRVRRDWQSSGGRLCMHCAYNLTGLPRQGTCPECGNRYDLDADAECWRIVGFDLPRDERSVSDEPPPRN